MDDIWRVCAWFMTAWLSGENPSYRDDNALFENSKYIGDKARALKARTPLRVKGLGSQLRADWQFHKQAWNLTGWTPRGAARKSVHEMFRKLFDYSSHGPQSRSFVAASYADASDLHAIAVS